MLQNLKSIFPFLVWMRLLTKETVKADIMAGLTGAVIVLPQGLAFATIAGLPPEYGLYTAMVTPVIAALFGSSFHLISGPTTAISIVVFSTISNHAVPGSPEFITLTLTLTFLAGIYQLVFGLVRLGSLVNFVSHTVIIGFTAGAALLIATSQMKHVTGIPIPRGEGFLQSWVEVFMGVGDINLYLFAIAFATLFTAIAAKKLMPKSPNLLVGMLVGGLLALFFRNYTDAIPLVGEIPATLPPLSHPVFSLETIKMLAPEAFAVALLGLIEAVSISQSIATKSHQRIEANQEFIGQGLSNIVGSFFSSYAGSGSFTRSGINYDAGAKSPLSAILAAFFLVLIILLIAPLTAYLPVAAMGGIILLVAYNLVDFHHIRYTLSFSKSESSVLLTTFFATLFLELEFAIYLGVLLSLVIFLAKTATPEIPTLSFDFETNHLGRKLINVDTKPVAECKQLKIIRIDRSVYFGSINHVRNRIAGIADKEGIYKILIVASGINFIDLSGVEALLAENHRLKNDGGGLYFIGLKPSVYEFAAESHFIRNIGADHFFDSKKEAFKSLCKRMDKDACATCQQEVFRECERRGTTNLIDQAFVKSV